MVVAVSSTADSRRGAPSRPAFTAGEVSPGSPRTRGRAPRPWAASLQRPAAKILVAGGLTLAGWLLTAALSGNTAGAAEQPACPQAPVASTVDHDQPSLLHHKHRKSHRETGAATCAQQPGETPATEAKPAPASEPAAETEPAAKTQAVEETTAGQPAAKTTEATRNPGLLGGLVGGVLDVVGGTLSTVTTTVSGTLSTVGAVTDTLSHTVLAPLTQPPADNPDAPVLLPLDDVLSPVLNGGSNSGGATATVPAATATTATAVAATEAPATTTDAVTAEAATQNIGRSTALAHFIVVRHEQPRQAGQDQPRDSGVHARDGGGGDSTPGLPGGSTAPSAPAPTAAPGHDGPGGARHAFAVHTDDVTTTQLKLIGASRDHDVDGAGREAALPTTSPD